MGWVCFYQSSICFPKIVHRIYFFLENEVPVDNLKLLLLKGRKHNRTFLGTYLDWYRYCAFNLNGHLNCGAESCCTLLYFELNIFVDLIEKYFAKTRHARSAIANCFYLFVQNWSLIKQTSMIYNGLKMLSKWAFVSVGYMFTRRRKLV